jgi:hypothetical protein
MRNEGISFPWVGGSLTSQRQEALLGAKNVLFLFLAGIFTLQIFTQLHIDNGNTFLFAMPLQ